MPIKICYQTQSNTDTHDWVLAQVVVRSTSYCIQMHQILKIADLLLDPFLHTTSTRMLIISVTAEVHYGDI